MQIVRYIEGSSPKGDARGRIGTSDSLGHALGFAVDIGTTTVVVRLYDIEDQVFLGQCSRRNAQNIMGKDVVMRMMHCLRGQGQKLRDLITGQMADMMGNLLEETFGQGTEGCRKDCRELVVVGNTAMCHIFLGMDVSGIAGSPFHAAYSGAWEGQGVSFGWTEYENLRVRVLPGIASHVGADAMAMLLHQDLDRTEKTVLAVDIGTNAEMVLANHGALTTGSVPAGPAFEGMEISCGMAGGPGAITGIRLAPQTGNTILEVIARKTPCGLCGSGLIQCIGQLLRYGLVDENGVLAGEEQSFLVCEPDLRLTQDDVRQYQLAKASIQAGMNMLLCSQGISWKQIDHLEVAGVFGANLPQTAAVDTGMLPPDVEIRYIGNAAMEGAVQALLDPEVWERAVVAAQRAGHVEFAQREDFQKKFIDSMTLKRQVIR